ncbi:peroxidase 28-like [Abrus precatorius]|uniref:Peroxidase n=1 Tax=Abrus precatorius TaxID=3816 RepID=A0A8B8M530_ABRPR|nr:peroxidase 28-like [Abrus precatorius]
MTRIFLTSLLLFHLFLVPSKAAEGLHNPQLPFRFPFPFGFPGRVEEPPQEYEQDKTDDKQTNQLNPNLREGFYSDTCPNAEKIVADVLANTIKKNPNAVANLIRLQFHDCFVVGCDASVLLDYSRDGGDQVEKSSMFNGLLLKGADLIDEIKTKLEEQCPQTVSCADTLAFATNEAMTLAGLPPRKPLGGRRDGLDSRATVAEDNNLPLPNWSMDQMLELFNKKGFNAEEMVVLLGAHSVGYAHCDVFVERLNNFQKSGKPDPELPGPVINELKGECKDPGTPQYRNPPVSFDETPTLLDNLFFKNLVERKKSLLITDSHLIADLRTTPIVQQMAADAELFRKRFAEVMVKLSSLNVLTGNDGEVRKICRSSN